MADLFDHQPNLPSLPFMKDDLHPIMFRGLSKRSNSSRSALSPRKRDSPLGNLLYLLFGQMPLHLHPIGLVDPAARVHERFGKIPVVGEKKKTFRIIIETADRIDPLPHIRDEVHHR